VTKKEATKTCTTRALGTNAKTDVLLPPFFLLRKYIFYSHPFLGDSFSFRALSGTTQLHMVWIVHA
jgi:hypothetical protein